MSLHESEHRVDLLTLLRSSLRKMEMSYFERCRFKTQQLS